VYESGRTMEEFAKNNEIIQDIRGVSGLSKWMENRSQEQFLKK